MQVSLSVSPTAIPVIQPTQGRGGGGPIVGLISGVVEKTSNVLVNTDLTESGTLISKDITQSMLLMQGYHSETGNTLQDMDASYIRMLKTSAIAFDIDRVAGDNQFTIFGTDMLFNPLVVKQVKTNLVNIPSSGTPSFGVSPDITADIDFTIAFKPGGQSTNQAVDTPRGVVARVFAEEGAGGPGTVRAKAATGTGTSDVQDVPTTMIEFQPAAIVSINKIVKTKPGANLFVDETLGTTITDLTNAMTFPGGSTTDTTDDEIGQYWTSVKLLDVDTARVEVGDTGANTITTAAFVEFIDGIVDVQRFDVVMNDVSNVHPVTITSVGSDITKTFVMMLGVRFNSGVADNTPHTTFTAGEITTPTNVNLTRGTGNTTTFVDCVIEVVTSL